MRFITKEAGPMCQHCLEKYPYFRVIGSTQKDCVNRFYVRFWAAVRIVCPDLIANTSNTMPSLQYLYQVAGYKGTYAEFVTAVHDAFTYQKGSCDGRF